MASSLTEQMVLKTLLRYFHGDHIEEVTGALSSKANERLLLLPTPETPKSLKQMLSSELELENIHYSWIAPVIKQYPKALRPLLLECLEEEQGKKVAEMLEITLKGLPKAQLLKQFLLKDLWRRLHPPDLLPTAMIRTSSLSQLLTIEKDNLVDLIDYLGVYDLADIIRHIVDKTKLKAIIGCLEPQHQRFLRSCLHQSSIAALPPLNLEGWKGEKTKLLHMLHRRGLLRFSKALSGCNSDLLWHITRHLDSGRGRLLEKDWSSEETPHITVLLRQQLMTIVNFMTPDEANS